MLTWSRVKELVASQSRSGETDACVQRRERVFAAAKEVAEVEASAPGGRRTTRERLYY